MVGFLFDQLEAEGSLLPVEEGVHQFLNPLFEDLMEDLRRYPQFFIEEIPKLPSGCARLQFGPHGLELLQFNESVMDQQADHALLLVRAGGIDHLSGPDIDVCPVLR